MFTDNKYTLWYNAIICNSVTRQLDCYTERHHIIPKSLGGDNSKTNIAVLTAREHFVCHKLLTKMLTGKARSKMCFALQHFLRKNTKHKRSVSSRDYEWVRKQVAAAASELHKGKTVSVETIEKFKATRKRNNKKPNIEQLAAKSEATRRSWAENYDCRAAAIQRPEVRAKMSASAKERGIHPNSWIALQALHAAGKGSGNTRARHIRVTNPDGQVWDIHGAFQQFCTDHKLPFSTMNLVLKGRVFTSGATLGWSAQYMD